MAIVHNSGPKDIPELLRKHFDDNYEVEKDGYLVFCPSHTDVNTPSLRITARGDKVLITCRANCETEAVLAALGLTLADLTAMRPGEVDFSPPRAADYGPAGPGDIARMRMELERYAAAYAGSPAEAYAAERFGVTAEDAARLLLGYSDELGGGPRLVVPFHTGPDGVASGFQARALEAGANVRWLGPRNPEAGSWSRLAYLSGSGNWPEVMVTEGPGDALTAACALGYDAVGVRGAGMVRPETLAAIREAVGDRPVIVAGDGDTAGRKFTRTVADGLADAGLTVRVLELEEGQDLTDWRKAAGTQFEREVRRALAGVEAYRSPRELMEVWDVERYPLTDAGAADFIRDYAQANGGGVHYSDHTGKFYLLDRGVWRVDELGARFRYLDAASACAQAAADNRGSDDDTAKALRRFAKSLQSNKRRKDVLEVLSHAAGVAVSVTDFDQHPDILACNNGFVDLRTGELLDPDPDMLITKRVNFDYLPEATAPRWEQFLKEIFPTEEEKEIPDYLRRLIGYGITGHANLHCFAVLYGKGANGKSVFLNTLSHVFKEHHATPAFSTFEAKKGTGIPNDIAALRGARLAIASEGDQNKEMAEATLKRITGGDSVPARFLHKEFFEFTPEFLLLLASNYKPAFKGQDEGLWRRVKLIHFAQHFDGNRRDLSLEDKLRTEAEGILAWAVRGAVEYYANNRNLTDPEVIVKATAEYRESRDALAEFLQTTGYVLDPAGCEDAGEVWLDYATYADEDRWKKPTFWAEMQERGVSRRPVGKKMVARGIRKLTDAEQAVAYAEAIAHGAAVTQAVEAPKEAVEAPQEAPRKEFGLKAPEDSARLEDVLDAEEEGPPRTLSALADALQKNKDGGDKDGGHSPA